MNPVDQFTPQEPILFNPVDLLSPDYIDQSAETLHARISPLYSVDEERWLSKLLPLAKPSTEERDAAAEQTRQLVEHVRNDGKAVKMVDSLLLEYSLDTQEGILLMSLAEALIRVPDNYTADALIHDKMSVADWKKHIKNDNGFMVNASTWGMMMTGRVVSIDSSTTASGFLDRMTKKMGEPVIRSAMQKAMRIMGHQFVLGETIEDANKNSQPYRNKGYTYSFDMLGEAAIAHKDAENTSMTTCMRSEPLPVSKSKKACLSHQYLLSCQHCTLAMKPRKKPKSWVYCVNAAYCSSKRHVKSMWILVSMPKKPTALKFL